MTAGDPPLYPGALSTPALLWRVLSMNDNLPKATAIPQRPLAG